MGGTRQHLQEERFDSRFSELNNEMILIGPEQGITVNDLVCSLKITRKQAWHLTEQGGISSLIGRQGRF